MSLNYIQLSRTTLINLSFRPNQTYISYFEYEDSSNKTNETLLKSISLINILSPYIYGIFGTILNLFLIVSYRLKEQRELHKHHMPYFCFAYQLNILIFFFSNVTLLDNQRLVEISSLNCKLFTYFSHISSTYTTWILANGTFVLKCHVNKQHIRLDLNRKFLLVMPFLFGLFYASDLFHLDVVMQVNGRIFCGVVNNYTWLLLRDFIDFFVFNVITVSFISYNLCPLKTQDTIIPKLKVMIPLAHTLLNFPISFLIFFRDYQIKFMPYSHRESNYMVEFLFTLAHLLSQCDAIIVVMGHVFLFKHYRNVFQCVCCCKCLRWQFMEATQSGSGGSKSKSKSRSRSRSSRARKNSPNDILTLDELRKLDLST